MKTTTLTVGFLLLTTVCAWAQFKPQQVINNTGGTYNKNNYRIDWSVGELALINVMKPDNAGYMITNGFIQPFTERPASDNKEKSFTGDEIVILPNPTRDFLEINILTKEQGKIALQVYDALGNPILSKEITSYGYGHIERINMSGYANAVYVLKLELNPDPGYVHKKGSYKIVKVQ